jgi:hypothetical protein
VSAGAGISPLGLRFPFHFDPELLHNDLSLIGSGEWTPHYNERDFGGAWQGVALRSATGSPTALYAKPAGEGNFIDTPLRDRCGYFSEILRGFQCPLKSVRLLSLAPGSFIREHCDHALDFEDGEIRIHIPIRTNPDVEFYVCGERLQFDEGGCYYVNVNLPHRVNNRGQADRIHLVIDAVVNDWVRELFGRGDEIPRCALPPHGFDEFAGIVFGDAGLREKLRAIPDCTELLRTAVQEAAARGFDLNEADMEAAFRSRPAAAQTDLDGWLPVRAELRGAEPWTTWIYPGEHRFTEPFFQDCVSRCMGTPFTNLFRREMPLRALEPVRPDGFIFHMSRCGSTLVSRSLAAAESTYVMSEPPPLDAIVQMSGGRENEWLEWMVSALAQARRPNQTSYLIKLDSWHVRELAWFRAVYPDAPWIFVVRDPLEVLVSLLHAPGLHASPGAMDPAVLGMRQEDITGLSRQQWCMQVLEGFLTAALRFHDDPKGLFVDYRELPGAICGKIARHFGLGLSPEDIARATAAMLFDAKHPEGEFIGDHDEKRKRIDSLSPDAGIERLLALYREFRP